MLNSKNKKLKQEYEDDIYNNLTDSFDDNIDNDLCDDIDESDFSDDFEDKITIEEDYSYEINEDESGKFDLLYHFNTNKHKQEGKHRLKEDTIFKGKNDKKSEEYEEYGFEEIEKEVKKMCNLGEMIARENIEKGHSIGLEQGLVQGQKLERRKKNIELITNLMNSLSISFSKAVELLKVSEDEVLEIKKYFEA